MITLIIEDDENKLKQLSSFLVDEYPGITLMTARSYTSGLRMARENLPELILLDMSLPNYDGEFSGPDSGKFRSYGGRDILYQLRRRRIEARVLVVTQYDAFSSDKDATTLGTLTEELRAEFPHLFVDAIYYSASQDDWRQAIRRSLIGILP